MKKRCPRCGGIIPNLTFETFAIRIFGSIHNCKHHIKNQDKFDFKEFFRYVEKEK